MNALTYTIMVGNKACTYDCGICISKMTSDYGIGYNKINVDWKKFDEATKIAVDYKAQNVLFTGKGEPTLFSNLMTKYIRKLSDKSFKSIELQTNGSIIATGKIDDKLKEWHDYGLDRVVLSIYHFEKDKNEALFRPKYGNYFDLPNTIDKLHNFGFKTRLSCVMLKDYIDNTEDVDRLIDFAKHNSVDQLTLRSADRPSNPLDLTVARYIDDNRINLEKESKIAEHIRGRGKLETTLTHGAPVYIVDGQNVCLTTGLDTKDKEHDGIRHLIFFPQGWLTTSWENVQGGRII